MNEPRRRPGQDRIDRLNKPASAVRGVLIGCLIGIIGPFVLQFGSPALTLVAALLGFFNMRSKPEVEFWRAFTITCAIWFLINGACAGFFVWAFTQGRG